MKLRLVITVYHSPIDPHSYRKRRPGKLKECSTLSGSLTSPMKGFARRGASLVGAGRELGRADTGLRAIIDGVMVVIEKVILDTK